MSECEPRHIIPVLRKGNKIAPRSLCHFLPTTQPSPRYDRECSSECTHSALAPFSKVPLPLHQPNPSLTALPPVHDEHAMRESRRTHLTNRADATACSHLPPTIQFAGEQTGSRSLLLWDLVLADDTLSGKFELLAALRAVNVPVRYLHCAARNRPVPLVLVHCHLVVLAAAGTWAHTLRDLPLPTLRLCLTTVGPVQWCVREARGAQAWPVLLDGLLLVQPAQFR